MTLPLLGRGNPAARLPADDRAARCRGDLHAKMPPTRLELK